MKLFFFFALSLSAFITVAQVTAAGEKSLFYKLNNNDSVIFYQCHVEDAIQQIISASGQTLTGKSQKFTITEKYVITKIDVGYRINYYTSALNVFPNKKFSGLKVKERPYWNFEILKQKLATDQDLKVLLAMENKGREATEYDFGITKYTTNQIIIKNKKAFKQLVIDGQYVVSKLLVFD